MPGSEVPAPTLRYQLMVCTQCNLLPQEISPVTQPYKISANATIKIDRREPMVMLVIPHRTDCAELRRKPSDD